MGSMQDFAPCSHPFEDLEAASLVSELVYTAPESIRNEHLHFLSFPTATAQDRLSHTLFSPCGQEFTVAVGRLGFTGLSSASLQQWIGCTGQSTCETADQTAPRLHRQEGGF